MAKSYKTHWNGFKTATRVLVAGRWLPLDRAKLRARQIVAQEAKDSTLAAQERLAAILG